MQWPIFYACGSNLLMEDYFMLDLLATDIPGQTPSKPVHMLQA